MDNDEHPKVNSVLENAKQSCKTYIEQTKLLVTLSSAFLIPPAVAYSLLQVTNLTLMLVTEFLFVFSTVMGYVVLATISGSQAEGKYDIYRLATRISSILQFSFYILGLLCFTIMVSKFDTSKLNAQGNSAKSNITLVPSNDGWYVFTENSKITVYSDTTMIDSTKRIVKHKISIHKYEPDSIKTH